MPEAALWRGKSVQDDPRIMGSLFIYIYIHINYIYICIVIYICIYIYIYGDGSKLFKTVYPCSSHQSSWDLWMFIHPTYAGCHHLCTEVS